jgi:hypothetical protein
MLGPTPVHPDKQEIFPWSWVQPNLHALTRILAG